MFRRKLTRLVLLALLAISGLQFAGTGAALAQQLRTVGIPTNKMDASAAEQQKTQWCWAATIQMALGCYGIDVAQEDIVRRAYGTDAYGNVPDVAGSYQAITQSLVGESVDRNGQRYTVNCEVGQGAPSAAGLIQVLNDGQPVILAIANPMGGTGHAVVCTAVSFFDSPMGPMIQSIVVRDPRQGPEFEQNHGRYEISGAAIAQQIACYWVVTASHDGGGGGNAEITPKKADKPIERFQQEEQVDRPNRIRRAVVPDPVDAADVYENADLAQTIEALHEQAAAAVRRAEVFEQRAESAANPVQRNRYAELAQRELDRADQYLQEAGELEANTAHMK